MCVNQIIIHIIKQIDALWYSKTTAAAAVAKKYENHSIALFYLDV